MQPQAIHNCSLSALGIDDMDGLPHCRCGWVGHRDKVAVQVEIEDYMRGLRERYRGQPDMSREQEPTGECLICKRETHHGKLFCDNTFGKEGKGKCSRIYVAWTSHKAIIEKRNQKNGTDRPAMTLDEFVKDRAKVFGLDSELIK